ncbi:MAG: hypothetical protein KDB07_10420, partial [Planctomycetes bacterium]|nr:hypothetical protein [Planctomycetota bacterium]
MKIAFLSGHPYCQTLVEAAQRDGVDAFITENPLDLAMIEDLDALIMDQEFFNEDISAELPQFGVAADIPLLAFLHRAELSRHQRQVFALAKVADLITPESSADELVPRVQMAAGRRQELAAFSARMTQRLTGVITRDALETRLAKIEKRPSVPDSAAPGTFGHELLVQVSREFLRTDPRLDHALTLVGIEFNATSARIYRSLDERGCFKVEARWNDEPDVLEDEVEEVSKATFDPIIREIHRGEPLIADSSPQHQQSTEL